MGGKARKPTAALYRAYLDLFRYFNRTLFNDTLPEPVLTFTTMRNVGGYYCEGEWHNGSTAVHHISLHQGRLGANSDSAADTLVHEMVHLWQHVHGTPSTSGNYSHNAEWADKMESIGLMPSATGETGGKRTGSSMSHYVITDGAFQRSWLACKVKLPYRAKLRTGYHQRDAKLLSKLKMTCDCGSNIWGKSTLEGTILCDECDCYFENRG